MNTVATHRPEDGITFGCPFPRGTGGSNSFRIPALVTLGDGTLVAAADARWNTTYDGGGLDTVTAVSRDGGKTWHYQFANYLADNGDVYNGAGSTCFIDPALAVTAADTVYMLVDLYPYGVALNGSGNTVPVKTRAFDEKGRLLLSGNDHESYDFFLENREICRRNGEKVSGWRVDDHFNLTGPEGCVTNLFFADSPFKVVRTGFLYLTVSRDGGESWSAPRLLDLKTEAEMACLVAPGRGLVTQDGTILFPVYSFRGDNGPAVNTQRLSFLSSRDGEHWERSPEFDHNWASESAAVELQSGDIRFFFRNGTKRLCYVDYCRDSQSWGSAVVTDMVTNSNCQLSAVSLSRTKEGCQIVLVSCPSGPNEAGSNDSRGECRVNGKIFVGLVEKDGTMTWKEPFRVTREEKQFLYSCLTELSDGTVALLYENLATAWGTGPDCYYTMAFQTFTPGELGL